MKILRILLVSIFVIIANPAEAGLRIIRDAEIEEILTKMAKSIFKVAGLRPESAKIYIIQSKTINAFTIGNGYIFLTTGLLLRFKNPLHILGILCHETAHIAAGHINRHLNVIQQRSRNFALATLLGIVGTVVTGSEEMLALLIGYAETDERFYLRYSRGEELAADSLAVTFLKKLGYGADVLIETFSEFLHMDHLNGGMEIPTYMGSHPRTNERIQAIRKQDTPKKSKADEKLIGMYNRILIKLKAYLDNLNSGVLIPADDYSKAIYFHRVGRCKDAIALLRKLLKTNPNDIYYQETLAQTLYESGHLDESIRIYEKIYSKNAHVLIKIDYANVLIEANKNIELAISILESARITDYFNSDIYRLLAKAYGKQGKIAHAELILAWEQMILGNYFVAYELIISSLKKLNPETESSQIKQAKYFKELLKRDYKKYFREQIDT
ncbi:MAG: M48 family metalloprotease [Holosporaceae bacterium]|jgi:predicted Zn-dependent protease|nr:M48 family metalloprotease [Holosporaceae bacterium]